MRPHEEVAVPPVLVLLSQRLLDERGFGRVSPEIVAEAGNFDPREVRRIFQTESDLEETALQRALRVDEWAIDAALARARDLSADPVQVVTLMLRFLSDASLDTTDERVPGWRLAPAALRQRVAEPRIEAIARDGVVRLRERFADLFDAVLRRRHPSLASVDGRVLADLALAMLEGPADAPRSAQGEAAAFLALVDIVRLLDAERPRRKADPA